MRKTSLLVIFLTVFIDLIGFGIVLPVLPLYGKDLGALGWQVGLIVASYSAMQFLFAPAWGRLSDRIGRRPVLLISTAGASISYALFALAAINMDLRLLVASRVFAGICGANLSVASAYIADVSPPEDRSKRMGLIGMAFGLGFILGPKSSYTTTCQKFSTHFPTCDHKWCKKIPKRKNLAIFLWILKGFFHYFFKGDKSIGGKVDC